MFNGNKMRNTSSRVSRKGLDRVFEWTATHQVLV